jgi:hypothetical protein
MRFAGPGLLRHDDGGNQESTPLNQGTSPSRCSCPVFRPVADRLEPIEPKAPARLGNGGGGGDPN